jgi:hypothetical protein
MPAVLRSVGACQPINLRDIETRYATAAFYQLLHLSSGAFPPQLLLLRVSASPIILRFALTSPPPDRMRAVIT